MTSREYALRIVCSHDRALLLQGCEADEVVNSAQEILAALIAGFRVERVSVTDARKTPFGCDKCRGILYDEYGNLTGRELSFDEVRTDAE